MLSDGVRPAASTEESAKIRGLERERCELLTGNELALGVSC